VLLCNYFLSMGKKAWLIIGTAIPEVVNLSALLLLFGVFLVNGKGDESCHSRGGMGTPNCYGTIRGTGRFDCLTMWECVYVGVWWLA